MSSEEDDIDVKVREKSSDEDNKDENEKEKKIIIKRRQKWIQLLVLYVRGLNL
jgi:uncharacterized protein with PIN domain